MHAPMRDPAVLAGYIGRGQAVPAAVAEFAERYALQNEKDYQRFLDAIDKGVISATKGL